MSSSEEPISLGGFVLIDRIGKGGMGEVWRAERTSAGSVRRRAAVKRILREYQRDPVLRERFLAEARITARLEHPNVVQVLDFGDQPELYLVLEYVEGVSVAEVLKAAARGEAPLPLSAVLYIIAEAATGLDYAHRRMDEQGKPLGIIHRDVSPGNILVSSSGAVKVNDFGVARAADNIYRTAAGLAVGKLVYMAPEQATGKQIDRRADIFSLGICMWELLTHKPLISRRAPDEAIRALAKCEFPPPSSVVGPIPPEIETLVREALSLNPADRPPTAAHLARALRTALATIAPGFDGRDLSQVIGRLLPKFLEGAAFDPSSRPGIDPSQPDAPLPARAITPALNAPMGSSQTYAPSPTPVPAPPSHHSYAPTSQNPAASQPTTMNPQVVQPRSSPSYAPASHPSFVPQNAPNSFISRPSIGNPNVAQSSHGYQPVPMTNAQFVYDANASPSIPAPPPHAAYPNPWPATPSVPSYPSIANKRGIGPGAVVAIVLGVLTLIGSSIGAYFLFFNNDASSTDGAVAPPNPNAGKAAATNDLPDPTRVIFVNAMHTVAFQCAMTLGMGSFHGVVHADISVLPTGHLSTWNLRVDDMSTTSDQQLASCMTPMFQYAQLPPMDAPVDVHDLTTSF